MNFEGFFEGLCLSVFLSVCLSVCLSLCLSCPVLSCPVHSVCLPACLPFSLSVYLLALFYCKTSPSNGPATAQQPPGHGSGVRISDFTYPLLDIMSYEL
jgi:hypothetical protein